MGTRADFYVGVGASAEWIGSKAFDGYPEGIEDAVLRAATPGTFRAAVLAELGTTKSATYPKDGWPWPWEDSRTSDYSYWFDTQRNRVVASCFGHPFFDPLDLQYECTDSAKMPQGQFPQFDTGRHAPAGTDRAGNIVVQIGGPS